MLNNYFSVEKTDTLRSAVTKPVVGVFDLASNVSEGSVLSSTHVYHDILIAGIRNTTTVFDNPERDRTRLVSQYCILSRRCLSDECVSLASFHMTVSFGLVLDS